MKTLDEFKDFLNDLADLNVDEPTQRALLAAREYIAEDDNPKSNRVLQLIREALYPDPVDQVMKEQDAGVARQTKAGGV